MSRGQHKGAHRKLDIGMSIMLLSFLVLSALRADLWIYAIIIAVFLFGAIIFAWGFASMFRSKGRSPIIGGALGLLAALSPYLSAIGALGLLSGQNGGDTGSIVFLSFGIGGITIIVLSFLLPDKNRRTDKNPKWQIVGGIQMSRVFFLVIGLILGTIIGYALAVSCENLGSQTSIGSVAVWTEQAKNLELQVSLWKRLKKRISEKPLEAINAEERTDMLIDIRGFLGAVLEQASIVHKEAAGIIIKILESVPSEEIKDTTDFRCLLLGAFGQEQLGFSMQEVSEALRNADSRIPDPLKGVLLEARIHAGDKNALADLLERVAKEPNYRQLGLLARQILIFSTSPELKKVAGIPNKIDDIDGETLLRIAQWFRNHPVSFHYPKVFELFLFKWP